MTYILLTVVVLLMYDPRVFISAYDSVVYKISLVFVLVACHHVHSAAVQSL